MAKKISFNDRREYARRKVLGASQSANTPGLRNELTGMKRMLRIFEGESDETIKAEKKARIELERRNKELSDGGGER